MQKRHMATAATVLTILAACAACGGGGSDAASKAPTAKPATTGSDTSDGGGDGGDGSAKKTTLAGIDYCHVLSAESLTPFGYTADEGVPEDASGHDGGCTWDGKAGNRVLLFADLDTVKIDRTAGRNFDVSGFPSVAMYASDTSCQLQVEVGEDGLTVIVESLYDRIPAFHGKSCETAVTLAEQVVAAAPKA